MYYFDVLIVFVHDLFPFVYRVCQPSFFKGKSNVSRDEIFFWKNFQKMSAFLEDNTNDKIAFLKPKINSHKLCYDKVIS